MAQVYKTPLEQSKKWSVPAFNKDALVSFLKQYGSGFTDDEYEEWAKKKGKELKSRPLNPEFLKTSFAKQWYGDRTETYADQYLNDDEWLQEVWPDVAEDAIDYYTVEGYEPKDAIDGDYERSYGPVDTRQKYDAYLKWLKEGK